MVDLEWELSAVELVCLGNSLPVTLLIGVTSLNSTIILVGIIELKLDLNLLSEALIPPGFTLKIERDEEQKQRSS